MVVVKEDSEDESLRIDCPVLVTERLVLRPPHEDDVPDLARLANNRRIAEMLARMPHPYGVREGRAFVAWPRCGKAPAASMPSPSLKAAPSSAAPV
jgi:hypothetical protein